MVASKKEPSTRRQSQRLLKAKKILDDDSIADIDKPKDSAISPNTAKEDDQVSADLCEAQPEGLVLAAEGVGSDDEGPEDVSLSVGRQVSMETRRKEKDHVKRKDDAVREKRRKKHELFKSQKVSKTITKFPEEALEELSLKLAEQKASKTASKRLNKKLKRRQKLLEPSAPAEAQHGSIKVVALAEHSGPEFAGGPLTEDFRRQHFYGDRLKRLPILSIQAKKYRNLPAKNFVQSSVSK